LSTQKKHYSYSLYAEKKIADEYEYERFGSGFGAFLKIYEIELYNKLVPSFTRLLDVGAGTGKLSAHFAKRGYVVASDASLQMLIKSRNLAGKQNIHFDAVVCDAHHLSFKDGTFDTVVSSRVLMHLVDWKKAVSELCRISQKSVILDFPNFCSITILERVLRKLIKLLKKNVQSYRGFLGKTVAKEFEKNNFRMQIKLKSFSLPVALYRAFNSPKLTFKIESFWGKIGFTRLFGSPITIKFERQSKLDYEKKF